ncbi:putative metalloprotease [Rhodobacter viridis]|uniref:Putative metalloprotease n=1 Tax=Rhodobacter viridis TaxID=1054202 RepID=A0A318U7H8_9RHOB|nr:M48 family metallopeptidase [Rhodobacter viridis]PYF12884.1 putative metalloprotease [Rhodobacter viridis]
MILRLLPFLLVLLAALAMWHFSSRNLLRQLSARSAPLTDPGLAPVLARLRAALGVPSLPVFVYAEPTVNGLAAPDGRVFLTEGFMALYRSGQVTAEEIASVIAHELGHVASGHAKRRMIDFTGQNVLQMVLVGVLGRIIPVAGVWLANLIIAAIAAQLSQRDEYEADAFATALLIKAGIGAEPQLSLFARLDSLAGGRGAAPAWLSSHPETERRIAAIRANVLRWTAA